MINKSITNNAKQPIWLEWYVKVFFAFLGLSALSASFASLQGIARDFSKTTDDIIFINNRIPWFAVIFFALGWFTINWIEIALLKKKITVVIILFLIFFLEVTVGLWSQIFLTGYGIVQRFLGMAMQLVFSGAFLRWSMIRNETIAKVFIGKRNKSLESQQYTKIS